MTEIEKLKLLLGITDDVKDGILTFTLETVNEMVKNFCNLEEVPEELKNTVVRMAADLYRSEGYGQESAPQFTKSVSRGDVTVTYADSYGAAKISGEKAILNDYRAQLVPFRKLRW